MFEKVWDDHVVVPETADTPAVLFIDLHLTHEVTTPQAYTELRARGLKLRRPDLTLATMDHSTPTRTEQVFGGVPIAIDSAAKQVQQLEINAREFGVELFNLQDSRRGIVHIIGPELGITQPGKTIVCGDSHTSTHGAFGALAFGIGTTEVGHVLATQCLLQRKPKTFAINVTATAAAGRHGERPDPRHHRQDRRLGRHRATCSNIRGAAIEAHVDGRAHDHLQHVHRSRRARRHDRARRRRPSNISKAAPRAPKGADVGRARSRAGASYPPMPAPASIAAIDIDAASLVPMVTYGTHPGMVAPITGSVPAQRRRRCSRRRSNTWVSPPGEADPRTCP